MERGWIGRAILQVTSKRLPRFSHIFSIVFNHLIKNPQTTNALTFLTHNISAIGGVDSKGKFLQLLKFSTLKGSYFIISLAKQIKHGFSENCSLRKMMVIKILIKIKVRRMLILNYTFLPQNRLILIIQKMSVRRLAT